MAHVYVHPRPYSPPSSALSGFLRAIALLAEFDWATQPLMIDLGHQLTAKDVADIQVRALCWRVCVCVCV